MSREAAGSARRHDLPLHSTHGRPATMGQAALGAPVRPMGAPNPHRVRAVGWGGVRAGGGHKSSFTCTGEDGVSARAQVSHSAWASAPVFT